jgi:dolichol-phosphate mannosyltransferase
MTTPQGVEGVGGRRCIDIVVPAYNEELCVEELARRLAAVFDAEPWYAWRAIVVENGSTDRTWSLLQRIAAADSRFTVVRLARNFHMDGGLTAGLEYVTGDACVFMTADLQDPPEAIPEFVRQWEAGHDNVYGLVTERQGTGPIRRLNSQAFYWLANTLSDGRLTRNASDFRLMDRRLYETLRQMDERNRFMRGLVAWAGFDSVGVPVPRPPRFAGESKAYTWPVIGMAIKGIFAHSYKPLRLISVTGFVASLVAVVLLVYNIWRAFAQGVPFAGYGTITSLLLLIFGMLSLMLGVIAEYIALIYEEVKRRPNFVVKETVGLSPQGPSRDC